MSRRESFPEIVSAVLALAPDAAPGFDVEDHDTEVDPAIDLEIARLYSVEVSPLVFESAEDAAKMSDLLRGIHAALPDDLMEEFSTVDHGAYVVLLPNNPCVSKLEAGRLLKVAEALLVDARFEVWPEGETLEVSPPGAPHFQRSPVCACGAPDGFGCLCPKRKGGR